MSVYLATYPLACLSIYQSTCLPIRLSIHRSVSERMEVFSQVTLLIISPVAYHRLYDILHTSIQFTSCHIQPFSISPVASHYALYHLPHTAVQYTTCRTPFSTMSHFAYHYVPPVAYLFRCPPVSTCWPPPGDHLFAQTNVSSIRNWQHLVK